MAVAMRPNAHPDHVPKLQTRRANRGPAAAHLGLLAVRTSASIKTGKRTRSPAVVREELAAEMAALERYQEMGAEFDD
jgi:hypothetical protein